MRLLLDECLPRRLRKELPGHEVWTVGEQRWTGLENGALLRRAASDGFAGFITADQNLQYQQNLAGRQITVFVLKARTNRLQDLRPLIPELIAALAQPSPSQIVRIGAPRAGGREEVG